MTRIETDYLIIGAGTAGMAFADALITECDSDVVIVDRRNSPGGHWNDAYGFVRLHQPSATYGVNSRTLGTNSIDAIGCDAGFYERASAPEICGYYRKLLNDVLLPSGRVRFFNMSDYVGDWASKHIFTSRLTGVSRSVRVRRKVVDTTYLESSVPATHEPSFAIDPGVWFLPVGELVNLAAPPGGYTILGGGKTAMDACYWLLDNGVEPEKIRWIRPRDAWVMPRVWFQPRELVASAVEGFANGVECLAFAEDIDDLFRRLEATGWLRRFDRDTTPTMFRGAILSDAECQALEQITQVIRLGRIKRLSIDCIELQYGTIPSDPEQVHVDCTARGFRVNPERPIFEPGRITIQGLVGGFTSYSAALIGFIEATRSNDAEKNRICPPVAPLDKPHDWIRAYLAMMQISMRSAAEPDLATWLEHSRLNTTGHLIKHKNNPRVQAGLARTAEHMEPAIQNAERLLTEISTTAG